VQIILVSRHLKAARTITIMPRHLVMVVVAFLALVFFTSAALFMAVRSFASASH
jgi:hypothetical protein